MGQISPELTSRLTAAVERMPAFPKSVQSILELTRDINCPPKALVAVIEKDPVIAIKILKIVNSAYFSLPSKVTSINQSVIFLGMNTLKNLALNFSTVGMLPQKNAANFDIQSYLLHSLLTAGITRMLVDRFADGEADVTDAYTVGLLHNFGKVVFAQFMPQEFHTALELAASDMLPLHHAEERVIGADHALVGAMLAQRWQFAPSLVECIGGHHQGGETGALAECLHVADLIAEHLCAAEAAMRQESFDSDESLPPRFGGNLASVASALSGLEKITENARQFCRSEALK